MKVLLEPGLTPSSFGVGLDGEYIFILSPCCTDKIRYDPMISLDPAQALKKQGVSRGPGLAKCIRCGEFYKAYSDTSITLRGCIQSTIYLKFWTEIEDITLEEV